MNATETGDLLGLMAFYDNRKIGDADVLAWLQVIGDLDYADAKAAVLAHYGGESTERMMPGHVRQGVKRIRNDRIARSVIPAPPAELTDDPKAYQRALQEGIGQAAIGNAPLAADQPRPLALTAGQPELRESEPPRRLGAAMAELRRVLGPARARSQPLASPQEIADRQAAESRQQREAREAEDQDGAA